MEKRRYLGLSSDRFTTKFTKDTKKALRRAMKNSLSVFIFTACLTTVFAQQKPYTCRYPLNIYEKAASKKSIHQEESEKYAAFNFSSDAAWDSLRRAQTG